MSEAHPKLKYYKVLKQPAAMSADGNMTSNWREWKSAFDYYMIATGKENAASREKCALFLHVIGRGGRKILDELDLDNDTENDYEKLVSIFAHHYDPTSNVNYERYVFFETFQHEDSFDKYFDVLKLKSKSCEFGQLRSSLILTQIIRGLNDEDMREQLLGKSKLDLEDAVAWCRAAEVARQQVTSTSQQVNRSINQPETPCQHAESGSQRKENAIKEADSASQQANKASQQAENVCQKAESFRQQAKNISQQEENSSQQTKSASQQADNGPQRPNRRVAALQYYRGVSALSSCDYCGCKHDVADKCMAWDAICYRCEHIGHFARMCRAK